MSDIPPAPPPSGSPPAPSSASPSPAPPGQPAAPQPGGAAPASGAPQAVPQGTAASSPAQVTALPPDLTRAAAGTVVEGEVRNVTADGRVTVRTAQGNVLLELTRTQVAQLLRLGTPVTIEVRNAASRPPIVQLTVRAAVAGGTPGAASPAVQPAVATGSATAPPTVPLTVGRIVQATVVPGPSPSAPAAGTASPAAPAATGGQPPAAAAAAPSVTAASATALRPSLPPGAAVPPGAAPPTTVAPPAAATPGVQPPPQIGPPQAPVPRPGASPGPSPAGGTAAATGKGNPAVAGQVGAQSGLSGAQQPAGSASPAASGNPAPQPAATPAPPASTPAAAAAGATAAGRTLLPNGAVLTVRVAAVADAAARPEGAARAVTGLVHETGAPTRIAGQIAGLTAAGRPVVQSPVGYLALDARAELRLGTPIALDVLASRTAGGGTPSSPLPVLAREWPALEATLRVLEEQLGPAAARQAIEGMPRPGPQLTATLLFFMSALRGGDVRAWLGRNAVQMLETAGRGTLLGSLSDDFQTLQRATEPSETGWRSFLIPIAWDDRRPIRLLTRRERREGREGRSGKPGTAFLVDIELTSLGPFRLDGLVREELLDLLIRTTRPLPAVMRQDIKALFDGTLERTGIIGRLSFKASPVMPPLPVDLEAEPTGGRTTLTV